MGAAHCPWGGNTDRNVISKGPRSKGSLTRKPQEENLGIFLNQKGFPLKFTQLPIHWYHDKGRLSFQLICAFSFINSGLIKPRHSVLTLKAVTDGKTLRKYIWMMSVVSGNVYYVHESEMTISLLLDR